MKIPVGLHNLLPKQWDQMNDLEKKFSATFVAYAAGDAFGAYYEFSKISPEIPNTLMNKTNWPIGGTSDDTSLTILSLLTLSENNPHSASNLFIKLLQENQSSLRGLGPTTRDALGLPVKDIEKQSVGLTNGAMMRTAIFGVILQNARELNEWVNALTTNTHRHYAIEAAHKMANAFSGAEFDVFGNWEPPINGVSNDALETLRAVSYVVHRANNPLEAILVSCGLGGDTDTVAALSAGLVTSKSLRFDDVFEIPWLEKVDWSGIPYLAKAFSVVFKRLATK